jgi:hypothetical protein
MIHGEYPRDFLYKIVRLEIEALIRFPPPPPDFASGYGKNEVCRAEAV